MADIPRKKKTKSKYGDSNLALVKGDFRVITVNMPLSEVVRLRAEAAALGVTLNDYVVALLNDAQEPKTSRRRVTRTQKKKR